jgi:hypothetical protein
MAKSKKNKGDKNPKKEIFLPPEETSNSPGNMNSTVDGTTSNRYNAGLKFNQEEATKAPPTIQDKSQEDQIGSYAALIHKHILSKKFIPFILIVAVIGYCFIQDNGSGRLADIVGILWFSLKVLYILALYFIILGFQYIMNKIFSL